MDLRAAVIKGQIDLSKDRYHRLIELPSRPWCNRWRRAGCRTSS